MSQKNEPQIYKLEHRGQPFLSREKFILRMLFYIAAALFVVALSLAIGILGYHFFEKLSWLDALLNASMILAGMGPVNEIQTQAGKIFASFYALFSGIVFLLSVGVLIAPIMHRFFHRFHLELDDNGQ